jgi:hypothetical protein
LLCNELNIIAVMNDNLNERFKNGNEWYTKGLFYARGCCLVETKHS